mmetsp:Transcript_14644/g.46593  ORF Transcript_14644/g.46593 Transcript_14644/m.46593 type:complete len:380 (+) Transcript_14644:173-1312(+)
MGLNSEPLSPLAAAHADLLGEGLLVHGGEGEGHELVPVPLIKLVHVLHPVQAEGVQEGRERLHDHEHADRGHGPHEEAHHQRHRGPGLDGRHEDAVVEHRAQLGVRERQGPEAQVRGRVGHRPEHELDGVDHLVHGHLAEVEVLPPVTPVVAAAVVVGEHGVGTPLVARLVALLQDERLREKHPRHAHERDQHEEHLEPGLPREELVLRARGHPGGAVPHARHVPGREEHVDHHVVEVRRAARHPLEDQEEAQVAEERHEEENLGHELAPDTERVAEVAVVVEAHDDPEHHLAHSEDDGHLHLDRVDEWELGAGAVPHGVDPEGVGPRALRHDQASRGGGGALALGVEGGAAHEGGLAKEGHGDGEALVVEEAHVDGKH